MANQDVSQLISMGRLLHLILMFSLAALSLTDISIIAAIETPSFSDSFLSNAIASEDKAYDVLTLAIKNIFKLFIKSVDMW